MNFQWDESKNKINLQKHGIDFADVPQMFQYPMLITLDRREEYGEDRWIGIGILKAIIAVIVFREGDDGPIRIISARKATKYERKKYLQNIPYGLEASREDEGQRH